MKKFLVFLVCLFISGGQNVFSQLTIPNNSFENWNGFNPEGWVGLFNSENFQNVLLSDEAQEGDYSVELKAMYHPQLMNFVRAGLYVESNFSVNGRPEVLKGFFKGSAAGSDSLSIYVGMFKNANLIGFGIYYTIQTVSNWTFFMVPIYYTSSDAADEAFISITAGQFFAATEGTDYFIDNLYFEGPGAIDDQQLASEIHILPNPVIDIATLNFTLAEKDMLKFELINMQGVISSLSKPVPFNPGMNSFQISVSAYPSGIYFLRGLGEKSMILEKICFQH